MFNLVGDGMDYSIDDMSVVEIAIQLPMYGYAMIRLEKESENIRVSWIAISDGGSVIDQGERIINKPVVPLATIISKADVSTQEDYSSCWAWSWSIYDVSGEIIQGQHAGNWPLCYLESILQTIEQYTNDSSITKGIRTVMEA